MASCSSELLTGISPFARPSTSETLARVLTAPPDESLLPATTPPSVRRLIRRCLEKDTKRRWRHMGDVRIEIEETLSGVAETPVATRRLANWRWLAAAALITTIAERCTVWQRWSQEPTAPQPISRFMVASDAVLAYQQSLAISPGGERFAYQSRRGSGASGT